MASIQQPLIPSPIGDNLRQARERKGLTQLALAHKMGYTGNDAGASICHMENGTREPSLRTLRKIAAALGVEVGSLLKNKK